MPFFFYFIFFFPLLPQLSFNRRIMEPGTHSSLFVRPYKAARPPPRVPS